MAAFTLFHVALSLIGIGSGFVVLWGLLTGRRLDRWTAIFLVTTVLTSVTGFLFPIERFTPGHAVGILSLLALGLALWARYAKQLAGRWGAAYVVSAMISQYLNVAVLIMQLFQKVPALKAVAPTQAEPAFVASQLIVLGFFVAMTAIAAVRYRRERVRTSL